MKRFLRSATLVLALLIAVALVYGSWKNPEKANIDSSARSAASVRSIGSSLGTTRYEVTGPDTGPVVVLVHGFSVPSYIWDSTFTALGAAGFRTVRYDLFGRGMSDRPDVAYDGATYDAQLDELLDSLHVAQPVNLVGLSFGGFVTAHYTGTHPSRVRTLTLIDPASQSPQLPGLLLTPVIGPWFWQTTQVPGMAESQTSDLLHPERFPTWADQYRPQMRFRGFGRALLRTLIAESKTNFDSLYSHAGKSGVPVLLVWGKGDQTVPIALSAVVRRNIPQAEFFPIDSARHLPHMEQAPIVRAKLISFLGRPVNGDTSVAHHRQH